MAVTMKDIARDLGVSVITVSKALRHHADIGERTRERILARAKELNYTPNLAARSLVTGRTDLVGLVVPDLLHNFFAQMAKSLSIELLKKGYCLILSSSNDDAELEERTVARLVARRLDAILVASVSDSPSHLKKLEQQGTPLILIDRRFDRLPANFVGVDDGKVGWLAAHHLMEIGCKRIAHLRGPVSSPGNDRLAGYRKALAEGNVASNDELISPPFSGDVNSRENGAAMMRQLLALRHRPDGVFAFNDSMAMGAMQVIAEAGLKVPADVAVIGAGNLFDDEQLRVPLSTIDQRTEEIGERTAQLVLSILEAEKKPRRQTVILEPRLIVRASTTR